VNIATARLLVAGAITSCAFVMACQPTDQPPPVISGTHADSAEQVFYGVQFALSRLGVQQATLVADTVYMFENRNRLELRGVSTIFNTAVGAKNATLTSNEATYHVRQQAMQARGNVIVITEDGKEVRSPELRYDQGRDEITTDSTWTSVTPEGTGRGIGFIASPDLSRFECKSCSGRGIPGRF
jgi:LPS export ABC transporter protein LptC